MSEDPPALYHGTRKGFNRGGLLVPRSHHGGIGTGAPSTEARVPEHLRSSADWVYVTTSKTLAWVYAWHAPGRGRPKVLTVRPWGPVEPDPEHSPMMEAFRCEAATVVSVDLEPAITEAEARAGWIDAPI